MNKFTLAAALACVLSACGQSRKPAETTVVPAAAESTTLALPAPPADRTAEYLANPEVGDVLVVRFVPEGSPAEQFYFYRVFRLSGDTVYTHPARQPASSADADASRPDAFATDAIRAYTRNELVEYRQEAPADPQHSRLVSVRRGH